MTNNAFYFLLPKEPRVWKSMLLAVLVHVFLFLFLWVDVSWQNDVPKIIQAELWSVQPQEASHSLSFRLIDAPTSQVVATPPEKATATDISWGSESTRQVTRIENKQERNSETQQTNDSTNLRTDTTANAAKSSIADLQAIDDLGAWQKRVSKIVRSNIQFTLPPDGDAFSPAKFEIIVRADGSIDGEPQLIQSSNIPGFDEAVRRAIIASAPFPPNSLVRSLPVTLSYQLNDLKP